MTFIHLSRRTVIGLGAVLAVSTLLAPVAANAQLPQPDRRQPDRRPASPYYVPVPLNFREVDVTTLLRRLEYFGVELPVAMQGRITARLRGELPIGALNDGAAYRFRGQLTSAALTIEGRTLTDVVMNVNYDQGVLRLEELRFKTPAGKLPMAESGTFTGAGMLQVAPRGDLTLRMSARDVEISELLDLFPELRGFATGRVTATAQARAPATRLADAGAWTAAGQVRLDDTRLRDLPPASATAKFQLTNRVFELSELTGFFRDAQLNGRGTIRLEPPFPYQADATLEIPDASLLTAFQHAVETSGGSLQLTARLDGNANPLTGRAQGQLIGRDMLTAGLRLDRLSLEYSTDLTTLTLSNLIAEAYGGTLTGEAGLREGGNGTADLRWQRIAIGDAVKDLLELPFDIRATSTGMARLVIPLERPEDPSNWFLEGNTTLQEINITVLRSSEATAHFRLSDGAFHLSDAQARIGEGELLASAVVRVDPAMTTSADVRWTDLAIAELVDALEFDVPVTNGISTGSAVVDLPLTRFDEPATWKAGGKAFFEGVAAWEWRNVEAETTWSFEQNRLILQRSVARTGPTEILLAGDVSLTRPHDYSVLMDVRDAELSKLNSLPEPLRPPVHLDGRVSLSAQLSGTIQAFSLIGSGQGHASDLQLADARIDSVDFRFAADDEYFHLVDASAELYDGVVKAKAQIPRQREGTAHSDIHWTNVDLGQPIAEQFGLPARLEAMSSGELIATSARGDFHRLENWRFEGTVQLPAFKANGVSIGNLQAEVHQQPRGIEYAARGTLLDGRFSVTGLWSDPQTTTDSTSETDVAIQGADLSRLRPVFPRDSGFGSIAGLVDTNLTFHRHPDGTSAAHGELVLSELGWEGYELAPRLQGRIDGSLEHLVLSDFAGPFAGGRMRLAARINVADPERSTFSASLASVEIPAALALYWPDADEYLRGRMDLDARGRLGRPTTMTATASIHNGALNGLAVRGTRLPLNLEFDPLTGRGRLFASGASSQIAGGRVSGRLSIEWSTMTSVDADLRFTNVDLPTLLEQTGFSRGYGSGRISGRLTLDGSRVQSIRDVRGTLQAQLQNAQAFSYPIFQQMRPFLAGASGGTTFDEGELDARIQDGRLRILQLTMASPSLQMFIDGDVGWNGLMRLNVAASTSRSGENPTLARFLFRQLPLAAPIPVSLLVSANEFLSDRVIYLAVTGAVTRPVIRVLPAPLLRDAAIRFFLGQFSSSSVPL